MSGIFDELGVRPVLNAQGNRTLLGGNTVSADVRALMDDSEEYYTHMGELMDRVGEKIAYMLGVERRPDHLGRRRRSCRWRSRLHDRDR